LEASYTVREAAGVLKLHPKTVLRKIKDGELGATRIGRQYRITHEQLDTFCGGGLRVPDAASIPTKRRVLTSSVVDVDAISPDESNRITNSVMAALTDGPTGTRVDCIYYEEIGKMKIVIHGSIASAQQTLALVQQLLRE
jgi:excisionase family DNA binding protein